MRDSNCSYRIHILLVGFSTNRHLPISCSWRAGILPQFPKQFSTGLEITSHLVDQNKEYPPWKRDMAIAYDHAGGRAKVVVKEGINAGKTFLRLYGSKKEYMVREGDYPSCRRSYLGEWFLNISFKNPFHSSGVVREVRSSILFTYLHGRPLLIGL